MKELRKIQDDKRAKEQAVNSLESFIYETQEKLYEEEYEACSLEEDRDAIRANLSEASDWIYDVDADANATVSIVCCDGRVKGHEKQNVFYTFNLYLTTWDSVG